MKPWGIPRFEVQVKERSCKWRPRSSPRRKPGRGGIINAWERDTREIHHRVNYLCYLWSVPPEVKGDCSSHSGYWKKPVYLGLAMTGRAKTSGSGWLYVPPLIHSFKQWIFPECLICQALFQIWDVAVKKMRKKTLSSWSLHFSRGRRTADDKYNTQANCNAPKKFRKW